MVPNSEVEILNISKLTYETQGNDEWTVHHSLASLKTDKTDARQ